MSWFVKELWTGWLKYYGEDGLNVKDWECIIDQLLAEYFGLDEDPVWWSPGVVSFE